MLLKTALCDLVPFQPESLLKLASSGLIRTASGRFFVEPESETARIIEAEIKKHPTALFLRAKAIIANEPNSNGDYFSEDELRRAYQTFVGVPFFTNHDNQHIENAKGKIIFAEWVPAEKAIYTISFIDREAFPHICRSIEEEYVTGVSMGAMSEGAMILLPDLTEKPIEDVKEGDLVLSHKGNCQKVLKTHCEYLGKPMYEIMTTTYHRSPRFTEDHPVFIIEAAEIALKKEDSLKLAQANRYARAKGYTESFVGQDSWRKQDYSPVFKEASGINENDYVLVPSKFSLSDGGSQDSDLYYVYGAFLGDGYLKRDRNGKFEAISFCVGINEVELVSKITKILKRYSTHEISTTVCQERNGIYLSLYDRNLAESFAKMFGTGSKSKRIKLPLTFVDDAKNLICGYLDTDGCIVDKTNQKVRGNKFGGFQISSVNIGLLEDVQSLLISLGYVSRISTFDRVPSENSVVNINTVENTLSVGSNAFDVFGNSIKFATSSFEKNEILAGQSFILSLENKKYMACPVKEIKIIQNFEEPVYDLTVANDESYIADGIAVHNCSVEYSICNICGNRAEKTEDYCTHIRNRKGRRFTGRAKNVVTGESKDFNNEIVFEYNYGIKFIELSAVVDPACPTCRIQSLIPNDNFLQKAAGNSIFMNKTSDILNSMYMISSSELMKSAGKEEVDQLQQAQKIMEDNAVKLVQDRNVDKSFASDLVGLLADYQSFLDELIGAGYGNAQGVPGTADALQGQAPAPAGAPAPAPAGAPVAAPVASESVGDVSGSPAAPLVNGPQLPISAPAKPRRAKDELSLSKFAEELKQLNARLSTAIGEGNMSREKTVSARNDQKQATMEILSNSWQEKQDFLEYIKKVPSMSGAKSSLSVASKDDTFMIKATDNSGKLFHNWTFETMSSNERDMVRANPKKAASYFISTFEESLKNREGEQKMATNIKEAGATSVNKQPDQVQEGQLKNNRDSYHPRTDDAPNQVGEGQLKSLRKNNEPDQVGEVQLESKRTEEIADRVGEGQLESVRENDEKDVILQKQLDGQRKNNEPDQVGEAQLNDTAAPWERAAKRDSSKFKTAGEHVELVVSALADVRTHLFNRILAQFETHLKPPVASGDEK